MDYLVEAASSEATIKANALDIAVFDRTPV